MYPSIDAAKKVLFRLGGVVNITGSPMSLDYYQLNLKKSGSGADFDPTNAQDWICNKVTSPLT